MAEKNENLNMKLQVTSIKMAVVEYRRRGDALRGWDIRAIQEWQSEETMNRNCKRCAEDFPQYEFRWRYGWLALEPSDKCEIFKSE